MQEYYPPVGSYFKLEFGNAVQNDSSTAAIFQEVSGISEDVATEEITEGGENRFKYKVPSFRKYDNLILKRGFIGENSPLADWCQKVIQSDLNCPITPKDIQLTLLNEKGAPLMTWNFINAWPVKLSISNLRGHENVLVLDTLEFAYNHFSRIPLTS